LFELLLTVIGAEICRPLSTTSGGGGARGVRCNPWHLPRFKDLASANYL